MVVLGGYVLHQYTRPLLGTTMEFMSTRYVFVAICLLVTLDVPGAHAQQDTTTTGTIIVLKDGTSYTGQIVREDVEQIELRTLGGARVIVPRSEVRRIEQVAGEVVEGRWRAFDPNNTRLLFAPTARPIGKGQGYFAMYEVFFPFLAYGPGAGVSLAGGVTLFPSLWEQGVYIAPKVTVLDRPNVDAALGVLYLTTTKFEERTGIAYALTTIGPPGKSATFGVGFGYGDDGFSPIPAYMAGGEYQFSSRTKLLTENYYIPEWDGEALLTLAIRSIGRGVTADLGFLTTPEALRGDGFPLVPLINFMFTFGGHSAGNDIPTGRRSSRHFSSGRVRRAG